MGRSMGSFRRSRGPAKAGPYVPPMQSEVFAPSRARRSASSARRLRRSIVWAFGAVAAIACGAALLESPALQVRRVEVQGASNLLPDEAAAVLCAAKIAAGSNIVRFSMDDLRRRLHALPWVAAVRIRRAWPMAARVTVIPRRPVAELVVGGDRWEVDETSTPIRRIVAARGRPVVESARVATVLAGKPLEDVETREAIRILALGGIPESPGIAKIVVDPAGELCLNMIDGVTVQIGRVEALREKIALVRRMYAADRSIASTVATISVRYPDAPVCGMRRPASDPPSAAAATAKLDSRAHRPSSAVAP